MKQKSPIFAPLPTNPKFIDRTKRIYGLMVVLGLKGKRAHGFDWWCKCACGKIVAIHSGGLVDGTMSCGCHRREVLAELRRTHGCSETSEYTIWMCIKYRCLNPNSRDYHNYGGRGITICKRWRKFENFLKDMGKRPNFKSTVERKDNNGNYEPGNCVWATHKVQSQNKRTVKKIMWRGERKSIPEWAEVAGLLPKTVSQRLKKSGWSMAKTMTTPSRRKKPLPAKYAA